MKVCDVDWRSAEGGGGEGRRGRPGVLRWPEVGYLEIGTDYEVS